MMKKYCRFFVLLIFSMLISVGCDKTPRLKGLVNASGTIVHNDQPVEGALIMFMPAPGSPAQNRAASATTDQNGKFSLMTMYPDDGAFPGKYRVIVSKTQASGGEAIKVSEGEPPKFKDDRTTVDYLPRKYKDPESSGIEITIPDKGDKSIEIRLEGEIDTTPQRIQRGSKR